MDVTSGGTTTGSGGQLDNESGLAVSPAEAMAAFQVARQHGENAHRIFQAIEEEQRAMRSNWNSMPSSRPVSEIAR